MYMKNSSIVSILSIFFLIAAPCATAQKNESPIHYVNTFIGTAVSTVESAGSYGANTEELGQNMPAVLSPNGMNFWTPQTRNTEKKCVCPFYYTDEYIQGFRGSHWLVGGCTQDYGSMTLMPITGKLKYSETKRAAVYDHTQEISTPAYYSLKLNEYGIHTEMTATSRAAIFRLTYDKSDQAYIIVNPNSDKSKGYVKIDPEKNEIRGYNPVHRIYQGSGQPAGFSGYFIVRIEKVKPNEYGVYTQEDIQPGVLEIKDKPDLGAYIGFKVKKGEQVIVRVAVSFTGFDGALRNLETEIPTADFNRVKKNLEAKWNERLGLIGVEGNDREVKTNFYSAFYRASFVPHEISDVDGKYPAFSTGTPVETMEEGAYFEDFNTWDTYRALHPLLNIIQPSLSEQMIRSVIKKYEQGGWLPIFPCWNSYTAAMIGDHLVSVIGDAYVKGLRNFDVEKAYEAMRKNASETPSDFEEYKNGMGRRALTSYLQYGYIPLEDPVREAFHREEQVSRTLEYAYDDFVLAQVAKGLGKQDDYIELMQRSKNYKNIFCPETGYVRGRYADGRFISPFDPYAFAKFITEGTPCHYSWYVPHDVEGLMEAMGGKNAYLSKLDSMFTENRYWHGNEPCHQVAFMFNYGGEPWKTQQYVREVLKREYENHPGGLSGNDDGGQMSAWYVFASLGFYPVCPGTPYYMIASPVFEKATIRLENGKMFTIIARGASYKNRYIQSAQLNGKPYDKNYFDHQTILNGGTFEFQMGDQPNKKWGTAFSSELQ